MEEYLGKNIEEPFLEENHSTYAVKTLSQLPIVGQISTGETEATSIPPTSGRIETRKRYKVTWRHIANKLISKEDPLYIHKTCGLFALFSFIYRYFYVLPTYGNLGMDGSWFDHVTMAIHMLLAVSSLIFTVLRNRILTKPTVIWEEYRLHAIGFTSGCIFLYLFGTFWPLEDCLMTRVALFCTRLSIHVFADEVTRRLGPADKSHTTVRVNGNHAQGVKNLLKFYAFYQMSAIGAQIVPHPRLADLGYNTLIAIQSSAFLMTLVRKGLIR